MIGLLNHAMMKKKKDAGVNAGNAGYRPTVNWREITRRKKKIAHRQILICITSVGVVLVVLGIIFLVLGLFAIQTACPIKWDPLDDGCVYVSTHNDTWGEMNTFCKSLGAKMLELPTQEKNDEFKRLIHGETWMGLNRPSSTADFEWLSGRPFDYQNFATGAGVPNRRTAATFTHCVSVNIDGKWIVEPTCRTPLFGACEYQKSYNPLILIGPVLSLSGITILFLNIEVYQRHKKSLNKGSRDLKEDEERLIKKKPEEAPPTWEPQPLLSTINGSPQALEVSPAKSRPTPKKTKKLKKTPSRKSIKSVKSNKVGTKEATQMQEMGGEDSIKITRSHQGSAQETDQMELLLSPRNL